MSLLWIIIKIHQFQISSFAVTAWTDIRIHRHTQGRFQTIRCFAGTQPNYASFTMCKSILAKATWQLISNTQTINSEKKQVTLLKRRRRLHLRRLQQTELWPCPTWDAHWPRHCCQSCQHHGHETQHVHQQRSTNWVQLSLPPTDWWQLLQTGRKHKPI